MLLPLAVGGTLLPPDFRWWVAFVAVAISPLPLAVVARIPAGPGGFAARAIVVALSAYLLLLHLLLLSQPLVAVVAVESAVVVVVVTEVVQPVLGLFVALLLSLSLLLPSSYVLPLPILGGLVATPVSLLLVALHTPSLQLVLVGLLGVVGEPLAWLVGRVAQLVERVARSHLPCSLPLVCPTSTRF